MMRGRSPRIMKDPRPPSPPSRGVLDGSLRSAITGRGDSGSERIAAFAACRVCLGRPGANAAFSR